jgi:hypothetical protein
MKKINGHTFLCHHPEQSDFFHGLCLSYALYPELKEYPPDHEKRIIYDQAYDKIKEAVSGVLNTYEIFRREVKSVLVV